MLNSASQGDLGFAMTRRRIVTTRMRSHPSYVRLKFLCCPHSSRSAVGWLEARLCRSRVAQEC